MDQMSLFDGELEPGTYVETHGAQLSFEELTHMVGKIVILDRSTQSHAWYKAVRILEVRADSEGTRNLLFFDGGKQLGRVNERWFAPGVKYPEKAYFPN